MSNQARTWVDQVEDSVSGVANSIKENVKQPICNAINQIPFDDWKNNFYQPLRNKYDQWPERFTQFKQNNILNLGNENQRLIFLGLSTLAIVSITKGFSSGLMPIVRNSVVTYFGLGLVVAPEIYNPLLVKKNQNK
ncbi:unnamed protein product (macronuclear) [Paramecium tetraurelia]|uniref:Uncharacterized protein n=1 Tax=Paramecium tetraurelia TaxID=5888 RepID=A0DHU6_PARTE|nr:uncharacterized protein GSPATT00017000001 [Paramecium tetraurelia]CAK82613.1 unnamed protein product [Paramecium tetraurelia]|eukprot:XP_001450010.1 hypothetical protein (macronuclear) [Paramecium tetraurelia strain d4-2]